MNPNVNLPNTTIQDGKFAFGDIVKITIYERGAQNMPKATDIKGSVMGKVKGINAYVVNVGSWAPTEKYKLIKTKYGYPVRHLPLEWGHFDGRVGEIIISANELTRV